MGLQAVRYALLSSSSVPLTTPPRQSYQSGVLYTGILDYIKYKTVTMQSDGVRTVIGNLKIVYIRINHADTQAKGLKKPLADPGMFRYHPPAPALLCYV